jgi:hypothetical protein
MPLPFSCPHCGLETLVDDEFAGQSGPCAGCGKTVAIPYVARSPAAPSADTTGVSRRMVALVVVASIAAASVVFTLLITLVFPMFQVAGEVLHRSQCRSNLVKIARALRQYEVEHGTLPPAVVVDTNGKPLHSWRVLILPQLGEHGLYDRYHFDEPWDGPNNSRLMSSMPDVFACPADPDAAAKGETNYMVVTGPRTLFPGKTSRRTGSYHSRGANAVMADESVRYIDQLFPADYLESMTTPQGGEDIPWEVLD